MLKKKKSEKVRKTQTPAKTSMLRKLTPSILILTSLVLLICAATGRQGLLHLRQLNNELSLTKKNNLALESDIDRLNNEIYAIEHSSSRLEQLARENLGLARAEETIYVVREKNSQ